MRPVFILILHWYLSLRQSQASRKKEIHESARIHVRRSFTSLNEQCSHTAFCKKRIKKWILSRRVQLPLSLNSHSPQVLHPWAFVFESDYQRVFTPRAFTDRVLHPPPACKLGFSLQHVGDKYPCATSAIAVTFQYAGEMEFPCHRNSGLRLCFTSDFTTRKYREL